MKTNKKKRQEPPAKPALPPVAVLVPHTWAVNKWTEIASAVFPGTTEAGKHLVRCNKNDLHKHGALIRIGRELVIVGAAYAKWLVSKQHRDDVTEYEIPGITKEVKS